MSCQGLEAYLGSGVAERALVESTGSPGRGRGRGRRSQVSARGGAGTKEGGVGRGALRDSGGPRVAMPGSKGGRTAALTIVRVLCHPGRRRRSLLPNRRRTATSSRRAAHADGDSTARHWPAW